MQNTVRWLYDRFWYIRHYSWRNNYLDPLVKRKGCKFRGLCLHSTSVVILPNIKGNLKRDKTYLTLASKAQTLQGSLVILVDLT